MKRLVVLLLAALVLSACSTLSSLPIPAVPPALGGPTATPGPAAEPTDTWTPYTSTTGRFTVRAPKAMKESTQTISTLAGKIDMHMFMADDGTGAVLYMVGYADFPADLVKKTNPQDLLKASAEGAVGNIGGKVVSQVAGVQDGMQAREFRGDIPASSKLPAASVMRGRIYLVANRQYQVYVLATKDTEQNAQMDKFLNSFKFTAPK